MASPPDKVNRRRFLRRSVKAIAAGGAGVGLYACGFEPHWVEVVRRRMPLENLPVGWQGKTLVQISDLHVGPIVSNAHLRSAIDTVASLKPDLIFVTGDWMTAEGTEQVDSTIDIVHRLPKLAPTYGILGNHDYGSGYFRVAVADHLADALNEAGIEMLRNGHTQRDGLQIAGTEDLWSGRSSVSKTLRGVDFDRPVITMAHNPDTIDTGSWGRYRGWVLSGHTHGGQCWLPGIGAPIVPVNNRQYTAGEIDLGNGRRLYVNRALGYKQRVRLMVRPEITVFTLETA